MDRIEHLICNNRISNRYLIYILRSRLKGRCGRLGVNHCVSEENGIAGVSPQTPRDKNIGVSVIEAGLALDCPVIRTDDT